MGIISWGLLSSLFCLDRKSLGTISFPFMWYRLNEYELFNSNKFFILMVAGSALLLLIWVSGRWSTISMKSTVLSNWEKLAMLIANPHSSNSVME